MTSGIDRFVADQINLDSIYQPYPMQSRFHGSAAPYKCLGGAAGPGKTLCLIMDHMISCQEFNRDDAQHVHTLLLRRTHPKLKATLVTRFDEKVPKELYKSFNRSENIVTWKSGATTHFGSMQHEADAMEWQGQWFKIGYDEMAEFTFKQWVSTSAWNRCPVSPFCTKDGATNPVGVGSPWIRSLFVEHRACEEMDDEQKKQYRPEDYAYFPCTYLDNPVYAKDPQFLANLMAYPKAIRDALMNGSWDLVGGYFVGAFDDAENTCPPDECRPEPWHKRFISGDWGFEHWSAIYWHYLDDHGVIRTYKERLVKHHDPEMLAEMIAKESFDDDGRLPQFVNFTFSHDAFAQKTDANTIAVRMTKVMRPYGLPAPSNSGKDKIGREQTMYNLLRKELFCGREPDGRPILRRNWIISDNCPKLIQCLKSAPRDEDEVEKIAEFPGDDPLQGAGYGVYNIVGQPGKQSREDRLREQILATPDPQAVHFLRLKETLNRQNKKERPYWQ
jgi:hypothetical protein